MKIMNLQNEILRIMNQSIMIIGLYERFVLLPIFQTILSQNLVSDL